MKRLPLALGLTILTWPAQAQQPASTSEHLPRIAELSRTLETQALELFVGLSKASRETADPVLLHSHNFLGAARSFSQMAREPSTEREFLTLSFTLLRDESQLLQPLLAGDAALRTWTSIEATLADLTPLLEGLPPDSRPAEDDERSPGLELHTDGWHGNLLERYVRVKGKLSGVSLKQCDVLITDRQNRVVWSKEDHLSEIAAHYRTKPWAKGQRTSIRFSLRFPEDMLTEGENFITFKLLDSEGRQAFETVAVGK